MGLSDAAAKTVNIDCGALVAGASDGKHFGSDTFFEGGTAEAISGPAAWEEFRLRPKSPAPAIQR